MTDTPGRLLSSLSNADGKPPKVSGCVGVFFQLFDWNRRLSGKHLFSAKSLPAERPQSNKFNDEKLPMAKLLLIADQNRNVYSRNPSSECQSEAGSERSSESGSKKPGVVARLMGLESFPETEFQPHHSRELFLKQQSQQRHEHKMHHYQELQMLEDLLQRPEDLYRPACYKRDVHKEAPTKPCLREEKMPKNTKKNQDPLDKFAKLPLSPKKTGLPFASILSPSKSNKVTPPIKSQGRRTSLLMGAAARILDQPTRGRLTLDKGPGQDGGLKAAQSNMDVKKKTGKQVQNPNGDGRKGNGLIKTSALPFQGRGSVKATGSNNRDGNSKVEKQPHPGGSKCVKGGTARPCEEQTSILENEEELQSADGDSQASSSKENRNDAVKSQKAPKLSRSGSVKEDQPPTPPSRGSLFRSKSVREEAPSPQPLQYCQQYVSETSVSTSTPTSGGGKEVRLKREKRQRPQENSLEPVIMHKAEMTRRKPPLDQGRAPSRAQQDKNKTSTHTKPSLPSHEQSAKNRGLLSREGLFGTRKQTKSSCSKESTSKGSSKIEEKTKKDQKDEEPETKNKQQKKGSENSLMKSLLRRKPLDKAETVSSSRKKVVDKPKSSRDKIQQAYERQTKSGGSSPARNVKEPMQLETDAEVNVLKERNSEQLEKLEGPIFDISPEKLNGTERTPFEPDMLADKSLEEILKSILSKSLGRTNIGESPLSGKGAKTTPEVLPERVEGIEDGTVIDMDLSSPLEVSSTSCCHGQVFDDLPRKVLKFEDESQATTPLALPPDDSEQAKEAAETAGQPSPVSVLDFSALSPFPSETTTSSEATDEDGKRVLESDADSALPAECSNKNTAETLGNDFPETELPSLGDDVTSTSTEGQEMDFYVREVLVASGFTSEDQTGGIPTIDEIFQRLEKQRAVRGVLEFTGDLSSDRKFETPGSCHKLMYECIAEALNLVLDPFRDDKLETGVRNAARQRPFGEDLVAEVTNHILSWREMTLGEIDDLIEVDMNSASCKWKEFRDEKRVIGVDLERMIFRSMIEDLISDFVF